MKNENQEVKTESKIEKCEIKIKIKMEIKNKK
jgi:hypothetical protein